MIANQQRAGPGPNDKFVAGIIAIAAKYSALHGGKNISFKGARLGELYGFIPRIVRQFGGPAYVFDLCGTFDSPNLVDQGGCVHQRTEPIELRFQQSPVMSLKAVAVELYAECLVSVTKVLQEAAQFQSRINIFCVVPQFYVLDIRGELSLAQIWKSCQQYCVAAPIDDQTLKHAETKRIVSSQVVH